MQSRNHILFRSILYKWEIVAGFVHFKMLDFEFNYFIVSESDTKIYKVSGFEMKKKTLVRFWKVFLKLGPNKE